MGVLGVLLDGIVQQLSTDPKLVTRQDKKFIKIWQPKAGLEQCIVK